MGACASVGHGNRKPGTAAEERVGRREPDPQSPSLSEASVLIEGETGTGKELIARAVHYLSKRAPFPFIALNCGSLPDTLIEAELFGHERGAFTDAQSARQGLIAQAEGGTLFLDEIDTLPPKAQVGILRLVQDKCYRVLGSTKEHSRHSDSGSTNTSLLKLAESGLFRIDLYYRLCVFSIHLPRARLGDIPMLVQHFLNKHLPADRALIILSDEAQAELLRREWRGMCGSWKMPSSAAFISVPVPRSSLPIWSFHPPSSRRPQRNMGLRFTRYAQLTNSSTQERSSSSGASAIYCWCPTDNWADML